MVQKERTAIEYEREMLSQPVCPPEAAKDLFPVQLVDRTLKQLGVYHPFFIPKEEQSVWQAKLIANTLRLYPDWVNVEKNGWLNQNPEETAVVQAVMERRQSGIRMVSFDRVSRRADGKNARISVMSDVASSHQTVPSRWACVLMVNIGDVDRLRLNYGKYGLEEIRGTVSGKTEIEYTRRQSIHETLRMTVDGREMCFSDLKASDVLQTTLLHALGYKGRSMDVVFNPDPAHIISACLDKTSQLTKTLFTNGKTDDDVMQPHATRRHLQPVKSR